MQTKSKFDDYERVKAAAKELFRAVMWENAYFGGGEHEDVLDKTIDDCTENYADTLIENALVMCAYSYSVEYHSKENK